MGLDTLIDRSNGQIIDADHINRLNRVLKGDFVGRDGSGAPTPGQNLGTPSIPWGTGRFNNLVIDGLPVDPSEIAGQPNQVISGAVRSTSEFPAYLDRNASGRTFTILGAATSLIYDVNGVTAEIDTDIISSVLPAPAATNNTCQVNDASLTGQDDTRFLGENGTFITVDNMQSELTSKIGEFVILFNQSTLEWFYCRIASNIRLDYCRRGFMFVDPDTPNPAQVLNNNDVLELFNLGYIFAEDDGSTIDVTFTAPVIGGDEPASPATGDYWYDFDLNVWKRYNGSIFEQINRAFIGYVGVEATSTLVRPEYFGKGYRDINSLTIRLQDTDTVISEKPDFDVHTNGQDRRFDFDFFRWSASTDFETGFTRTPDRNYWLYLTEDGKPKISGYKPYDNIGFLRGWYHPHNSWRAVGQVYNNASDEFELVNDSDTKLNNIQESLVIGTLPRIILSHTGNVINGTEGQFILDDNTGQFKASALSKNINATWQQGNGNGANPGLTLTAFTYYKYFILSDAQGLIFDAGIDTVQAATNLLNYAAVKSAGLTKASYQGEFALDGALNIIPFYQEKNSRWFWFNPRLQLWNIPNYATVGPSPILRLAGSPFDYKHKAKINILHIGSGSITEMIFDDPDLTASTPGPQNANFVSNLPAPTARPMVAELDIVTNASGLIRESYAGAPTGGIHVGYAVGYENLRLKE